MDARRRKALIVEHGVVLGDVAEEVGCSLAVVSRVLHGLTRRDTEFSGKIKATIAARVGVSVDDLWPEPVEVAA